MSDPKHSYWRKRPREEQRKPTGSSIIGWGLFAMVACLYGLYYILFPSDPTLQSNNGSTGIALAEGPPPPRTAAPEGFKRIEVPREGIEILIPENWTRWEDQYFRDAKYAAAILIGRGMAPGEPVYSAASTSSDGSPIAIVQLLIESGPAPTQKQIWEMLHSGNAGVVQLPEKTAALFRAQQVPGLSLDVIESDWTDNGNVLCQYIAVDAATTGADKRRIRQWQCLNSSNVIWLTITSPSAMDGIYSEISSKIWESLEFDLDQTPRLK